MRKLNYVAMALLLAACTSPSERYEEFFHPNGKLRKEGAILDGKSQGIWRYYDEDGTLEHESFFVDGVKHGAHVEYWTNGNKATQGGYDEGALHGSWTSWYENGQMERQGEMVNGKEHGEWKKWTEAGELKFTGTYNNGQLVEATYVMPDRQEQKELEGYPREEYKPDTAAASEITPTVRYLSIPFFRNS